MTKNKVGRPQLPKHLKKAPFSCKLKGWIKDFIAEQPEAHGVVIENAIIKMYGLEEYAKEIELKGSGEKNG